jgi:hypothetical protein
MLPPGLAACLLRFDVADHRLAAVAPIPAEDDMRQVAVTRVLPYPSLWDGEDLGDLPGGQEAIDCDQRIDRFEGASGTNERYQIDAQEIRAA